LRSSRLVLAALLGAVILAIALAGCGSSGGSSTSGSEAESATEKIDIGTFAGADFAPLWMGIESGAFEEAGLEVNATAAPSGAAMAAQLTAGQLDFAGINLDTAIQAISKGVPMEIVASVSYLTPSNPSLGTVVDKSSDIKEISQLAGKTVATAVLQTTPDLGLRKALGESGDPEDVTVISVPPPEQVAAVEAGRVDAAMVPEPFLTLARQDPKVRLMESPIPSLGDHVLSGVVVSRPDYLSDHEEEAVKFLEAFGKQIALAQKNQELARKAIPAFTEVEPALAAEMTLPEYSPAIDTATIEEQAQLMSELGWISKTPSTEELVWGSAPE